MSGQGVVLLLAHGTPNVLGEMKEYLDKVTGGRGDATGSRRRRAKAPLRGDRSRRDARCRAAAADEVDAEAGGASAKMQVCTTVYIGMRNWHPYIDDTVAQMKADGVSEATVICLAPQTSRTSIGLYKKVLLEAAGDSFAIDFVEGWAAQPQLIAAFAERLRAAWAQACREAGGKVPVLFTAHSVPTRTVEGDAPDPYAVEARRTAELVAAQIPEIKKHVFAFQSQGVAGGPWIGPTVEETLRALKNESHSGVVIQPIGFVCDHVEVLYDIDIAFQKTAREVGLKLWRAESLNDSPLLIEALVALAK